LDHLAKNDNNPIVGGANQSAENRGALQLKRDKSWVAPFRKRWVAPNVGGLVENFGCDDYIACGILVAKPNDRRR
jgi:hypothetical protein